MNAGDAGDAVVCRWSAVLGSAGDAVDADGLLVEMSILLALLTAEPMSLLLKLQSV